MAGGPPAAVEAVAFATPLQGLSHDAAHLAAAARAIDGSVLLVGHAYGGAVVTVAGASAPNVAALVFVAGFALEEGESCVGVLATGAPLLAALTPAVVAGTGGPPAVELSVRRDAFGALIAAGLPAGATAVAAASQRPVNALALEEPAAAAAWRTLPSWYVVATADRTLPVSAQRAMAGRAGAETIEVEAGHAIARSHAAVLAALIERVARARA